jgi:hypothetical protein
MAFFNNAYVVMPDPHIKEKRIVTGKYSKPSI